MLKIDMDNLNPGTRFYVDQADPSAGSVTLRVCDNETLALIARKTEKKMSEYRAGRRYEWVEVDDDKRERLTWDYTIVDFDLVDVNGAKIEPTADNKVLLMNKSPEFAALVSQGLLIINRQIAEQQKALEKN